MLHIYYIIHSILAGNDLWFSLGSCGDIWKISKSLNTKKDNYPQTC
jgi:hypothetical protein